MTERIALGCVEPGPQRRLASTRHLLHRTTREVARKVAPRKVIARYPGGYWLPRGTDQGSNNGPTSCSAHVAVTTAGGVAIGGWVDQEDSCHFFIEMLGAFYQYKDFDRVAFGVSAGNYRGVITGESWDGLSPATAQQNDLNRDPWKPEQCERWADYFAWQEITLGIPVRRLHGTRDAGIGPHRTGIRNSETHIPGGNVYEGPDSWSSSSTKACCGDQRLLQLYGPNLDGGEGSILARARVIRDGVRAGAFGFLPAGDVDLASALARGGGGRSAAQWIELFAAVLASR